MQFKKATKIWASIKSKIWNVKHQVRVLPSIDSTENLDENIETEHLSTFHTIWGLINGLANIIGVDTSKDVEINGRIVFITLMICCAYLSLFYTMVVVWPSITTLLEVVCIFGVLLPATLKFRLVVYEMKSVAAMKNFFEQILINNSSGSRATHLDKEMQDALKNMKIFIATSIICFTGFSLYPIYVFVTENQLVPIMRIEFPFLDKTNATQDYLIGQAIMILFGFLGVVGSVAFDLTTLVLLLQYGSLVTQLKEDLADYHELWKKRETNSEQ